MKKFLLFAGCEYDARGGWDDFIASRDTLPEIKAVLMELRCVPPEKMSEQMPERSWSFDWYQIVDRDTLQRYEVHAEYDKSSGSDVLVEGGRYDNITSTSRSARETRVDEELKIHLLLTEEDLYEGDLPTTNGKGEYLSLWINPVEV